MYKSFGKRTFDLFFSVIGFVLLLPIFLVVTLILTILNRGNAFFLQTRPGKKRHYFKIVKFKTMNDRRDTHGNLLPDADRLTGIGRFIRKTSIDEIPQLLNVIMGDMSMVGPRPLLVEYLPLYNERQARRHEVRPGITGWAQVNGRNAISWEQKFEYDVWYVENQSLKIDVIIFFKTIKNVVSSRGINQEGSSTAEAFKGTPV